MYHDDGVSSSECNATAVIAGRFDWLTLGNVASYCYTGWGFF